MEAAERISPKLTKFPPSLTLALKALVDARLALLRNLGGEGGHGDAGAADQIGYGVGGRGLGGLAGGRVLHGVLDGSIEAVRIVVHPGTN